MMNVSVLLMDAQRNTIMNTNSENDDEVIGLLKSSLSDAVDICKPTSLPINLRRCGCPLITDPNNICQSYSLYEIVGIFEQTRKFACGKHLRKILKSSFTFPGLTIIYQGRFRSEINTPMPYYYPSYDVFVERMHVFLKNKGLSLPSFDISDIFKNLLPYGKCFTGESNKYILLEQKSHTSDEDNNQDICCICHEIMSHDKSGYLKKCNHRLHVNCLQKLIDSNSFMCPLCRTEITTEFI